YRTISYVVNDKIAEAMGGLNQVKLPKVLSLPEGLVSETNWQASWIPEGFKSKELSRYQMAMTEKMVESQLFSDGLFS
ncbi:MucB/RseB C-terminal domain-containing protein, partial [Salmonella enterica]|uniref:MucB/RseB C-terminal domain-containing protein n=1 Tax=Salmonella enterica TaxID=28901 RepID=UPI00224DA38F